MCTVLLVNLKTQLHGSNEVVPLYIDIWPDEKHTDADDKTDTKYAMTDLIAERTLLSL